VNVTQRLFKSWWLLAWCGVLNAIISALYLMDRNRSGALTLHAWRGTVILLGELTLAAGICTIAAGVWSSRKGKSWLLMLNGVACSVLGAILAFWAGPLAFRTIALLIVVMAISIGIYELRTARTSRLVADEWLLGAAGVASFSFAFAFLAFVFRWMKLEPGSPAQSWHWLGSYFGFSAICMLLLVVRLHRPALPQSDEL
jgi:uncharacterized membrane protein HdeD (DUF308 family)